MAEVTGASSSQGGAQPKKIPSLSASDAPLPPSVTDGGKMGEVAAEGAANVNEVKQDDTAHVNEAKTDDTEHVNELKTDDAAHVNEVKADDEAHVNEAKTGDVGHVKEVKVDDVAPVSEVKTDVSAHVDEDKTEDTKQEAGTKTGASGFGHPDSFGLPETPETEVIVGKKRHSENDHDGRKVGEGTTMDHPEGKPAVDGEASECTDIIPAKNESACDVSETTADGKDLQAGSQNDCPVAMGTEANGSPSIVIMVKSPLPTLPTNKVELPVAQAAPEDAKESGHTQEAIFHNETHSVVQAAAHEDKTSSPSIQVTKYHSTMDEKSGEKEDSQTASEIGATQPAKLKDEISGCKSVSSLHQAPTIHHPSLGELQKVIDQAADGLDLNMCRSVLTNLHSQNSGLSQELLELDTKLARLQATHRLQTQTTRQKQDQLVQLKLDYAHVVNQLEEKTCQNLSLQEDSLERNRLRTELTDLRQQNKILENELKSVQAKREYLEGEQRRTKHRENNMEIKVKEIRESQDEKTGNIRQLTERLNKATAKMEKVEKEKEKLERRLKGQNTELSELEATGFDGKKHPVGDDSIEKVSKACVLI